MQLSHTVTLYFQHGEAHSQLYLNWFLLFHISYLDLAHSISVAGKFV